MNSIKQYFRDQHFAKFIAIGVLFLWIAAIFGSITFIHVGFVVAAGVTAAVFGIVGIISAIAQHG